MSVVFTAGSYVWVPDDDEIYIPAQVAVTFDQGKKGQVKLLDENGKVFSSGVRKLDTDLSKDTLRMDEQSLKPISDMVALKNLDEASILHNLRLRYSRNEIYTNVGTILVSLNPFQQLPIYSPGVMDEYLEHGSRELDPHIYGLADDAFRAMLESGESQSCIISGESGAGKTEATKLFLQYLAQASSRECKSEADVGEESIQHKILETNPLMEAFGNAKTVRNNNSSRFGKFIEVQLDRNGAIKGASISNYLLEKVRVVLQSSEERNYHIFYQICAAASRDPAFRTKFSLSDASQYHFLNQSDGLSVEIDGVDDTDEWKSTKMAMDVVQLVGEERDSVIMLLAGILHLGNIEFAPGSSEDSSKIVNSDVLELCAEQLGCTPDKLTKALTQRKLIVGREVTWGNNTVDMACDARDALAKHIYALMFDWLIVHINKCLGQMKKKSSSQTIGVLDIFGFESFEYNSFEQLCINYTNEMLQGYFNEHIFKLEQEEYAKEGVDVTKITFEDNSKVIAMIDAKKNIGILSKCEEIIKTPRGTDELLLKRILEAASSSNGIISAPSMKKKKGGARSRGGGGKPAPVFIFAHYAGKVEYTITGFLEKNKDTIQLALQDVGEDSKSNLLKGLFKKSPQGGKGGSKKKPLGIQFRDQLALLMSTLNETQPHFVRCIKPNSLKVKECFMSGMVLDQLRYAGLLEVCRIRKIGYPIRKTFQEFVHKYAPLVMSSGEKVTDAVVLCQMLEDRDILVNQEYQVGKNKVFLRADQCDRLELTLEAALLTYVRAMQRMARGFIVRRRVVKWEQTRLQVEKLSKSKDMRGLEKALLNVGNLPHGGRYLPWVVDARTLLQALKDERRVEDLLETALESKDLMEIKRALKEAEENGLGDCPAAKQARKDIKKIEEEKKTRKVLREAVDAADVERLTKALSLAEKKGMSNSVEARDADALLKRLKEQAAVEKKLETAIKAKKVEDIIQHMNRLVELGQIDHPLVAQGEEVANEVAKISREREEKQERILDELQVAIKTRDLTMLNNLEVEVLQIGLEEHDLVIEAMDLRREMSKFAEVTSILSAEMRAVGYKAESATGITVEDLKPLVKALEKAHEVGVERNDPKLVEAKDMILMLEKQLEVQKDLDNVVKIVETKTKSKAEIKSLLLTNLRAAKELGINTRSAEKVAHWVQDIEQDEAHFNQKTLARRRQQNIEKLKEASKEELEEQALTRLAQLASEEHLALVDEAKNAQYELRKYYNFRTTDDFTEPVAEQMRVVEAQLMFWSRNQPIARSLLRLSKDQNKTAIRINRAILQYCGDLSTSFPATLAQYVLVKGLEDEQICDEIYAQLCKHLFANSKTESNDRAWLLMCMATKTFPPSKPFAPYLLNFLIRHQTLPNLPGNYARLCIVQLDATLDLGPSWFKPNLEEIECYRKRPPILAAIHLVDGEVKQIPVTPELRVSQVLETLRRQLGIQERNPETPIWGIFVKDGVERGKLHPRIRLEAFYKKYNPSKLKHVPLFLENWQGNEEELFARLTERYGPEPAVSQVDKKKTLLSAPVTGAMQFGKMLGLTSGKKTPPAPQSGWPLPWWAHLGDVYARMKSQNKEPRFEYKRRLFVPDLPADMPLFHQLLTDVKRDDLTIDKEQDVAELAVIALAMQSEDNKPPPDLLKAGLVDNMSSRWKHRKKPAEWLNLAKSVDKVPRSKVKLIKRFVQICQQSPTYGMCFFYARRNGSNEDFVVGVDYDGIHFLDPYKSKIEKSFPYAKVPKYGATVEYFWMNITDGTSIKRKTFLNKQGSSILLYTLQSWELYELVFDYTHTE